MKYHHSLIVGFGALLGVTAFATPFSIVELQEATKVAIAEFSTENPDHVQHFTGFKSWFSGQDARVKIYVDHGGMSMDFNFLCHKHDEAIECHAQ